MPPSSEKRVKSRENIYIFPREKRLTTINPILDNIPRDRSPPQYVSLPSSYLLLLLLPTFLLTNPPKKRLSKRLSVNVRL